MPHLHIVQAEPGDLAGISAFFEGLFDDLETNGNPPGWRRGFYPSSADWENDVLNGEMYLALSHEDNGDMLVAGAVTINGDMPQEYDNIPWRVSASRGETLSIHRLAVLPQFRRRGAARALVTFAEELARARGIRAIRLDTLITNESGSSFYESCGYTYLGIFDIGYGPAHGYYEFRLFEKEVV